MSDESKAVQDQAQHMVPPMRSNLRPDMPVESGFGAGPVQDVAVEGLHHQAEDIEAYSAINKKMRQRSTFSNKAFFAKCQQFHGKLPPPPQ